MESSSPTTENSDENLTSFIREEPQEISFPKIKLIPCAECDKKFTLKSSLNRHFKKKHPSSVSSSTSINQVDHRELPKFKCGKCFRRFSKLENLTYHEIRTHSTSVAPTLKQQVCPLCKNSFQGKEILVHFQSFHDIDIETELLQFSNFDAFSSWKKDMETETKSFFRVSSRNHWKSQEKINHNFICHRSGGSSQRNSEGKQSKSLANSRINAYCPSFLKVEEIKEGKCFVTFMRTHVGHEDDTPKTNPVSESLDDDDDVSNDNVQEDKSSSKTPGTIRKKMPIYPIVNFSNEKAQSHLSNKTNGEINEGETVGNTEDDRILHYICSSIACSFLNQEYVLKKNLPGDKKTSDVPSNVKTDENATLNRNVNGENGPCLKKQKLCNGTEEDNRVLSNSMVDGDIIGKQLGSETETFKHQSTDTQEERTLKERKQRTKTEYLEFVNNLTHHEEIRATEILLEILKDTVAIINKSTV